LLGKSNPGFSALGSALELLHGEEEVKLGDEIIGDNKAMTPPPDCFRTHHRAKTFVPLFEQM
jgi:hypothetical protein